MPDEDIPVRRPRPSTGFALLSLSFSALVLTQVALPLVDGPGVVLVSATVCLLAATSLIVAMRSWKPKQILRTALAIAAATWLIELIGSRTGAIFGEYEYQGLLQPSLAGVPLIVPLAWTAMTLAAFQVACHLTPRTWLQILVGAWLLTAWDLFLDPMMVERGFWSWANVSGGWHGIPWSNYLGWMFTGAITTAIARAGLGQPRPNRLLIGLYVWMTGFSALGFILPFAFDQPVIGVVGAAASLPLAVLALRKKDRSWLK